MTNKIKFILSLLIGLGGILVALKLGEISGFLLGEIITISTTFIARLGE